MRAGLMLICIVLFINVVAQNGYRTNMLACIATTMKYDKEFGVLDNGFYSDKFYKDIPLSIVVKNSVIEHIGCRLFTTYQRCNLNIPVCNFLERYYLALRLPLDREKEISRQIAEDGIEFIKGDFSFFSKLLNDTSYNVSITSNDGRKYKVEWHKENAILCSITFPAEYDLLNGSEMIENESSIVKQIMNTAISTHKFNVPSMLQLIKRDSLYVWPGESYYVDILSTDKYYTVTPNGMPLLIYTSKYPVESVANLFTTTEIENEYIINVTLKKYGDKNENFSTPLKQWMNYCFNNGCSPYWGLISYKEDVMVFELVMKNTEYGYNHIMKVTFDTSQLEQRKGNVTARLNCFIPSSKIKYLYDELKQ